MIRILIFNLLYISISLYALARGGAPERIGAVLLIANFQGSHWVIEPFATRYADVEWAMLAVDAGAFAALYILAVCSARFWPMWMSAVQGCVVLSHLVGASANMLQWTYGHFIALWSYALLAILAVATYRHRGRLKRYKIDPGWRWRLPPAYRAGAKVDEALVAAADGSGPSTPSRAT